MRTVRLEYDAGGVARGLVPICIKLSRLIHRDAFLLHAFRPGMPLCCQPWVTGCAFPFWFAQERGHITPEIGV